MKEEEEQQQRPAQPPQQTLQKESSQDAWRKMFGKPMRQRGGTERQKRDWRDLDAAARLTEGV